MKRQNWIYYTLVILLLLPAIYVGWAHYSISKAAKRQPDEGIPYMIVLGASLRGETMSLSLLYRMETALDYLQDQPETVVVVAGGQGPGEWVTEASAMAKFLRERGIAEERIILEDRSTSTLENIRYSKELLEEYLGEHEQIQDVEILLVSNDFHIYRARMLARRLGLSVQTLPATTPQVVKTKMWIREYAAIIKSLVFDW